MPIEDWETTIFCDRSYTNIIGPKKFFQKYFRKVPKLDLKFNMGAKYC